MKNIGLTAWTLAFAGMALVGACASSEDAANPAASVGQSTGGTAPQGGQGQGGTAAVSQGGMGGAVVGGSGGTGGCALDEDCANSLDGLYCDVGNSVCVQCLPTDDRCGAGLFCDATFQCVAGCTNDSDCVANNQYCDVPNNTCVDCVTDNNCALGTICQANTCVAGCNTDQPCPNQQDCCGGQCIDVLSDITNCGGCGTACGSYANAATVCVNGVCGMGSCYAGFIDCDQDTANGCEGAGACSCNPGDTQPCYFGPPGTADIGICKRGAQTCIATGDGWSRCEGAVVPENIDICNNDLDDDCNGTVDDDVDADGDGWTRCGGDCCDRSIDGCGDPALVNPGAYDDTSNGVDDDCDGTIDNPPAECDAALASDSSDPLDYARAIDLCQFTTETGKEWGVINAELVLSNGTGQPAADSRAIRDGFGSAITNRRGQRLAVLSTGVAADNHDDTAPAFKEFQDGQNMGQSSIAQVPPDFYQLNGNSVPNAPGCPSPKGKLLDASYGADTVMLKLRVRVPTNAKSFSAKLYFFSSEYPEFVCTPYNDFFAALVDSQVTTNPPDKNIAIYNNAAGAWPVGVNILRAADGLFTQCENSDWGCSLLQGKPLPTGTYSGCVGTTDLAGTGFDLSGLTPNSCQYDGMHGGGTGWLTMKGNVIPGEVMEIRFAIWDTGDYLLDSLVLLDAFEWLPTPSSPGVTPG